MDRDLLDRTLANARDWDNRTPDVVWRARYAADVGDLLVEVARLRAVEVAALALRARVREWGAIPYRGEGHEEEYELATNAAGDAILVAADAFDAAAGST